MRGMGDATADAIITDPPYNSGGFTQTARNADPGDKYCHDGKRLGRPSFKNDAKDPNSFVMWATLWMGQAARIVKHGGYAMTFTDWRMLPYAANYLQAGGFTWRGLIAWDKGRGSRSPHKGYIRHQCEYVVWGSNGPCHKATHGGPWDGCYQHKVYQKDKHHMIAKQRIEDELKNIK